MIGAVVLNYCCAADTLSTIEMLSLNPLIDSLVVVDNCSPDGSGAIMLEALSAQPEDESRIHILCLDKNLGYSGGNNAGLRYLIAQGITQALVINPDVNLVAECLQILIDTLSAPGVAAVSPVLIRAGDPALIDVVAGRWDTRVGRGMLVGGGTPAQEVSASPPVRSRRHVDTFMGACFLVDLGILGSVGLLPEYLFLYGEEVDVTLRLSAAGYAIAIAATARAVHERGTTVGSSHDWSTRSLVAHRESARSSVLLARVWWPRRVPVYVAARMLMAVYCAMRLDLPRASAIVEGAWGGMRVKGVGRQLQKGGYAPRLQAGR